MCLHRLSPPSPEGTRRVDCHLSTLKGIERKVCPPVLLFQPLPNATVSCVWVQGLVEALTETNPCCDQVLNSDRISAPIAPIENCAGIGHVASGLGMQPLNQKWPYPSLPTANIQETNIMMCLNMKIINVNVAKRAKTLFSSGIVAQP